MLASMAGLNQAGGSLSKKVVKNMAGLIQVGGSPSKKVAEEWLA